MELDTNHSIGGDPLPRARRWLAAAVAPATLLLVAGTMAMSSPGSALIPQPTTTVRGRPTTTTTVAGRPTTVPTSRETTTTTTTAHSTVPPTVPPTAASPSTEPPTSATAAATTTTISQPIPDPPTSPPTSEPETAAIVITSPVIVDPENPAVLPPVIVNVAIWCPANFPEAQLRFTVQNVDLYHYPPPFKASYSWTKVYSGGDSSGHLTLSGGESDVVGSSTSVTGPMTFTVTDDDLGGTATVEVDVPDCTNPPPPAADPMPPVLIVPMVTCAEDFDADSGTGTISFLALNTPGDDGSARSYDFSVTWVDQQTTEDEGSFDDIIDSLMADHTSVALHSGTYTVTVTDQADAALATSQSVDLPPCEPDVPPAEPVPPLAPPQILSVTTECADPVLLDGKAGFVVLNANYLFLGGSGELGYELTLSSGSPAVEFVAATYSAPAGVAHLGASQLAPATYTATFSFLEYPTMTDSVTFTIDDCSVNPQQPASPLDVYGVSAFCLPGDDTETLFFVIGLLHAGFIEWIEWSVMDGSQGLAHDSQENPGSTFNPVAVRHVPAGAYDLVVETHIDPLLEMTVPIEIGTCADPADPANPVDPVDPADPANPVDPVDPANPVDPVDPVASTDPEPTTTTSQPTNPTVTLPSTELSGALPATR